MKKLFTFATVVIVSSVVSVFLYSELAEDNSEEQENIIHAKIDSKILNETRELIIHLPGNYNANKKYPVMYVLDGGPQDRHIANKLDVLSAAGYSAETIVVGIPNMTAENREQNLTPPFMRTNNEDEASPLGNANPFLDFLETELIPFMESNYSASSIRLFSGHSRGGLTVMYSLIYKPDLFQGRFCYSAPFWRQENILVSKVAGFLNSRDSLNTFLFLSAGANETDNIRNGLSAMTLLLEEKKLAGMVFHSDITPKADHQSNAMISASKGIALWSKYADHR